MELFLTIVAIILVLIVIGVMFIFYKLYRNWYDINERIKKFNNQINKKNEKT